MLLNEKIIYLVDCWDGMHQQVSTSSNYLKLVDGEYKLLQLLEGSDRLYPSTKNYLGKLATAYADLPIRKKASTRFYNQDEYID